MLVPGAVPLPLPAPRRRGRVLLIGAALSLAAALAAGAGIVYVNRSPLSLDERAAAAGPAPTAAATPPTPAEAANAALKAQAAALLGNDERAWLAAVDPARGKLRGQYRSMFRSLRGLGVSHFDYRTSSPRLDAKRGMLSVFAEVAYCFSTDKCPRAKGNESDGPPTITQKLTFKKVGTAYLIWDLTTKKSRDQQQPTPWESGDLVFRSGQRVTVAAGRGERKYLKQVLAAAEKAARVNDRFAVMVGNPQRRYRVYVAGPEQWKTWYGGITDKWVIGYAIPLSDSGSDVVLNISAVRSDSEVLATTMQHELGHVVTLGGAHRTSTGTGDMWLEEGIAEYIGWYPRSATESWRRSAVRSWLDSGKRPTTIAPRAPGDKAGPDASDAFYGLGHFTADCLARKYGQGALFTFVRLYLRESRDLDPASQEAFGVPFATIDKTCMAWIRDKV
ncbi:hypothetical protein GCM10020358_62910 [Amorphoplanes nipponensis]|uniref:Peptidase MA superfamily protein n=1 Tax=Actinoplanes nipponensis TaxID=135950 RepID=A0A919MNX7_9ACTN|nr:hypothetical protein Ani05nite_55600 [Actinoplanes nipponensis]